MLDECYRTRCDHQNPRIRRLTQLAQLGVVAVALLACKMMKPEERQATPEATASAPAPLTAATPRTELAFSNIVPKSGTRAAVARSTSTKFSMAGRVYRESEVLALGLEVVGSDEFRVTKANLDLKEFYTVKQEGAGAEQKSVSPLAGSRYVVSRSDDGRISALDSNGTLVPASQLTLIKSEFAEIFEKNQTGAFLPERPVKIGEKLVPAGDSVMKMLSIKDDGTTVFDGIEFLLISGTEEKATFDVTMTMTKKLVAGLRLRAKLKGQIDIKPLGNWLLRVDLKGPLEVIDGAGATKATGDLIASITESYSP